MKKKAANRRPPQRLDERDLDYGDDETADKNVPDHVKDNDDYGDGDAKDLFYESDDDLLSKKEKSKSKRRIFNIISCYQFCFCFGKVKRSSIGFRKTTNEEESYNRSKRKEIPKSPLSFDNVT